MTVPYIPASFNGAIAHITDPAGNVFQVLNESCDDWDEAATKAQQEAFNNQQKGFS